MQLGKTQLRALLVAGALGAAGCGSEDLGSVGVAACRQVAAGINDPSARAGADEACRAIATGSADDVSRGAREAARQRCLQAAQRIVDEATRRRIEALCPRGA